MNRTWLIKCFDTKIIAWTTGRAHNYFHNNELGYIHTKKKHPISISRAINEFVYKLKEPRPYYTFYHIASQKSTGGHTVNGVGPASFRGNFIAKTDKRMLRTLQEMYNVRNEQF